MTRIILAFLLISLSATTLFAQGDYNDFVISESKRYKGGGLAMVISGVAMIGGGAAMISNDSDKATAMGIGLLSTGVALDIGSIFMFRKSKQILEDARSSETAPVSFFVSPQGVQFSLRF